MNDEELDRRIADLFIATSDGSDTLMTRLQSLRSNHPSRTKRKRTTAAVLRVAGGLATTVALVAGLLVYPRGTRPVNAVASVKEALGGVNTWHLKGWKMQNGKRVPWEVWGRREPFFYREQIGSDIVLDDGRQRVSIYGPSSERLQKGGVCLLHPSLRDEDNVPWSYKEMVAKWRDMRQPWKQTAQGPVFNFFGANMDGYGINTDELYFVNGRTLLPTRYEKWIYPRANKTARRTVAFLDAEYDRPLPTSAATTTAPPGYRVYDARKTMVALPQAGAVTVNGFSLQCQPLAMDKDGNILVRLHGWLGDTPIPAWRDDIHFQATAQRWASETAIDPPVNHDERGRAYAGVEWLPLTVRNPDPDTRLMIFTPREPFARGSALPRSLTAKFNASVGVGWGVLGSSLLREDLTVSFPLPEAQGSLEDAIRRYTTPTGHPGAIIPGSDANLEVAIYRGRADHYANRRFMKTITPEMQRYFYWMQRAIASNKSPDVQEDRYFMSIAYLNFGNVEATRRLLRDMVSEKRFSKSAISRFEILMRHARERLRSLDAAKTNADRKR